MARVLPLDDMSVEEKLQTLEAIWDDLVSKASVIPSPAWHKDVLIQREEGVRQGTESVVDWAAAKEQINKDIKEPLIYSLKRRLRRCKRAQNAHLHPVNCAFSRVCA